MTEVINKIEWHIEKRKVADLKEYEHNPRRITEKGFEDLKKSIDKFGLAEPLVIQPSGLIIGGHARYQVLKSKGIQEADCYVSDRELNEKEMQELNIRLNKNIAGEFDWDILANEFKIPELKEWGFEEFELGGLIEFLPKNNEKEIDELLTENKCPKCGYEW